MPEPFGRLLALAFVAAIPVKANAAAILRIEIIGADASNVTVTDQGNYFITPGNFVLNTLKAGSINGLTPTRAQFQAKGTYYYQLLGIYSDQPNGSTVSYTLEMPRYWNEDAQNPIFFDGTYLAQRFGDSAPRQVRITNLPTVPEPTTWAMFIGGFGLIGSAMRRRQRVSVGFA